MEGAFAHGRMLKNRSNSTISSRLDDIKDAAQKDPAALKGKDSDGWSAAHWASRCGYLELLSFIADRWYLLYASNLLPVASMGES